MRGLDIKKFSKTFIGSWLRSGQRLVDSCIHIQSRRASIYNGKLLAIFMCLHTRELPFAPFWRYTADELYLHPLGRSVFPGYELNIEIDAVRNLGVHLFGWKKFSCCSLIANSEAVKSFFMINCQQLICHFNRLLIRLNYRALNRLAKIRWCLDYQICPSGYQNFPLLVVELICIFFSAILHCRAFGQRLAERSILPKIQPFIGNLWIRAMA